MKLGSGDCSYRCVIQTKLNPLVTGLGRSVSALNEIGFKFLETRMVMVH